MKTNRSFPFLLRPRLAALVLSGAGCLFAGIALSDPASPDRAPARPTDEALAIAAVRRQVLDPIDAPLREAAEREKNRRLFSRAMIPKMIPKSESEPVPPAFHSVEILISSAMAGRELGGENPVTPARVAFRIHRIDPASKTTKMVASGYYDSVTGQVFLLDPQRRTNVPPAAHPLLGTEA